jgi:hypothetical protein
MQKDAGEIKEKILFSLRRNGPSLPVHLAKEAELSILFTSAFLSELFADKKIKMSDMRVGSSPVYFLQGQEPSLEKFSQHLKSREKDAFLKLREEKFLKDDEQLPAIRVALRAIKDFAIPFRKGETIFWRYYTIPETEFSYEEKPLTKEVIVEEEIVKETPIITPLPISSVSEINIIQVEKEKPLNIFEKQIKKSKTDKKTGKKKINEKNDKFFNKVKEFLTNKSIEILDIENFSKTDLILRIKNQGQEQLLIAYNKKKITESDILKAHKKAAEVGLAYTILSLGEVPKKLESFIDAIKNLSGMGKVE